MMFKRQRHNQPAQQALPTGEPVHVFDQTNGVLKQFEAAQQTAVDPMDEGNDRISRGAAIGGILGGGGI